ncbi:hypothetical protein ACQP10_38180 (plasmid) [Streptosporangium sandarakinum]|uniref:hypothetical protein n=1 Tax=Streptosporangium sandarakinum TaxID=1260955 RepID=UPI003D90682E
MTDPVIVRVTEQRTVVRLTTRPTTVRVGVPGLQGPPGPAGERGPAGPGGGFHIHHQDVPAKEWAIPHDLGRRPAVAVEDVDGHEIDANVFCPDTATVIVTLGAATAGRAHLS